MCIPIPSLYWLIVFNNSSRKCAWFSLGWASVGSKFRLKNFFIFTLRNFLKSFTKMIFVNKVQSIYKFGLSVCFFVSNKRQNGWTDRAQIFCGTSRSPREGLWMIKISNICLYQNSIVIKFFKILKIRELFLFCFTMYTKRTCSQLI